MVDRYRIRAVVNLVTLATPVGLLLARLAGCPVQRGPRRLHVATGYRPRLPLAAAFTVGGVIFFRAESVPRSLSLLVHEERHATQWACCLGLIGFPVLYGGSALWSWAISGDHFSGNVFERRAGLAEGGYRPRGVRWRRS